MAEESRAGARAGGTAKDGGEGWRERRGTRRRSGVRLALTDEEAEGTLQFDSSSSVCSCVVLHAPSARHPDNTKNEPQPEEELQGAPHPPFLSLF